MKNSDNTTLLINHLQWADAEVWKKVLTFDAAANDERIKKLLYHLHQVQYAFYFLWNKLPVEIPKPEQFSDLILNCKMGI